MSQRYLTLLTTAHHPAYKQVSINIRLTPLLKESHQSFQLVTTAITKQLAGAGISCTTLNHKTKMNHIGYDEITLGTDEDFSEVTSDGDVCACINSW